MDKITQMQKLLELFKNTPEVSVQYINAKLPINSQRKVISDLRAAGYPIKDRWEDHINPDKTVTRYKVYWLPKNWESIGTTCFDCLYRDIRTDKKGLNCHCKKYNRLVNPYRPMVLPNKKCPMWKEDSNEKII